MNRPYFQFPLCCLAYGKNAEQRLNAIISYCCVEMGNRLWSKYSIESRELCRARPPHWCRSTLNDDAHLQAVLGYDALEVFTPDLPASLRRHSVLERFVQSWERTHRADPKVRIATEFVFEARDDTGISYAELAVLCAIFSKIGAAKGPVRITRDEIWRRALGYKSERVLILEARSRAFALTKRQVRSIVDRLHSRNFFARVTIARRQTYYSHRLSSTALAEHVFKAKVQRFRARQARRRADAALTKRIQAECRKLAGPDATEPAAGMPL